MSSKSTLEKILGSVFYSSAFKKANNLINNSSGIMNLLKNVGKKINHQGSSSVISETRTKIVLLTKLLRAYAKGEYRDVELKNILIILASFIYFLSPIDLIPDFLPIIGFGDDMALLVFVYNSVSSELEKFEMYEMNKNIN